jgi:hypothetical protein
MGEVSKPGGQGRAGHAPHTSGTHIVGPARVVGCVGQGLEHVGEELKHAGAGLAAGGHHKAGRNLALEVGRKLVLRHRLQRLLVIRLHYRHVRLAGVVYRLHSAGVCSVRGGDCESPLPLL